MKNLKIIFALALIAILSSCSKDDVKATVPALPVISDGFVLENTTIVNIPDRIAPAAFGFATSPINTTKTGKIKDPNKVTLELDMNATWIGELVIELTAPNGASTAIIHRIGETLNNIDGDGSDFKTGEKLSFNASFSTIMPFTSLNNTSFIPTGNYDTSTETIILNPPVPNVPNVPLDKLNIFFKNKSIEGTWTLKIYDCAHNDLNVLNTWKLKFEAGALL